VIENALVMLIDDNKVPATEAGMLTAMHVKEGHSVTKGALLAEIDSRATLAKQRIAQGELAAALAQAENDAEVEVARHAIEVAKADLDANTEIRRTNKAAVSEAEHRKFVFQYQRSLAQEKQAINEKEIARLTATAKQAQLDATTVELELRQIRAPFDGQVVEIMKNVGDWVTAGEPIMHVVGLKRVRVKGFVPAHLATHQEVLGKPVTITVYSGGQREFTVRGTIGFASPVIEGLGTSRQFRIWAEVDNEESIDPVTGQAAWKIQPGSVAKMVIDLTPTGRASSAPAAASPDKTLTSTPPPGSAAPGSASGVRVQSLRPVTEGPQALPTDKEHAPGRAGSSGQDGQSGKDSPAAEGRSAGRDNGAAREASGPATPAASPPLRTPGER
jgi:multidrug efflux pump subunit AcrA (membrane-fusion protein)